MNSPHSDVTIRERLQVEFDDAALTLFCYDHFSAVYKQFTPQMRRLVKIRLLIQYCQRLDDQFESLVNALDDCTLPGNGNKIPLPDSPYRGLFAFRREDTNFFFGREVATNTLVQAVESRGLVVVLGASGSGKSSIVFAGVVPALDQSAPWLFTTFRPGDDPFLGLANALLPLYETELSKTKQLIEMRDLATSLREGKLPLLDVLTMIHQTHPDHRLLIVADQFEELYTLCRDQAVRRQFLDLLLQAIATFSDGSNRLVLTLRADFLSQASLYRPFADALQGTIELLGPMTRSEMTEAIEKPAQLQNVTFEAALVERILDDVGDREGSLPLLEFALTELWQHQRNRTLTHVAYDEIGEVEGALSRYADQVYLRLSDEAQAEARNIFKQLVIPGADTEDIRRVTTRSDLVADWSLVTQLATARLIVTNQVSGEEDVPETTPDQVTVELVHEALIRNWQRLRGWIDENRTGLLIRHRLADAAQEWARNKREADYLYRAAQLAQVAQISPTFEPNALEADFIKASRQMQNRARLRRIAARAVAILSVVAVGVLIWQIQRVSSPWQPVEGFPADPVLTLTHTNETPPTYYASTANIGIARSQGGGWNILRAGLPTSPSTDDDPYKIIRAIDHVTADNLNPVRLFAPVMGNGLYKSEDRGLQWQPIIETTLPRDNDVIAVDLAIQGDLILAVFSRDAQRSFYGSSDGGQTWAQLGGDGVAPLEDVFTVHIAAKGHAVYVGSKTGLHRSAIGPPWEWQAIADLDPVVALEPVPGEPTTLYLATEISDQEKGDIYRWQPPAAPEHLVEIEGSPITLAPHPGPAESVAAFVLLFGGKVVAITRDGQSQPLGDAPAFSSDLLVIPATSETPARLLLGSNSGLLEYQDSLSFP